MPRRPRLYLPDQPQHVVVRGHNRDPVAVDRQDFRFLYQCLSQAAKRYRLTVHAWVLMHNHIHLLTTPADEQGLPQAMQSLGGRYAQHFNHRYQRSGSLWEGRYKAALIDSERYMLCCYRYIELNPVRAGLADRPQDYPYSSFHHNGLGKPDPLVTPHVIYQQLTADSLEAYRALFEQIVPNKELNEIRAATEKGFGLGRPEFLRRLAQLQAKART